ncbi:hypothetical protein FBEOM_2406 [Fusarium beomiforme]|uniref:CBM-cenC domain-containing protein n=1 Tax=Fusarium beomiforme TaxID=44412 RepID=A0A9P5AS45_9HYPO|nr:hypothetical protein FBEOM_2406 [Fusarium beomiforme]
MRLTLSALQLLALCQLASASPCKPSSSVTLNVPTSTNIEPAFSATETSATIASGTDSSTTSYDTLTVSETESTSELSISTTLLSTSSVQPTTTIEATTDALTTFSEGSITTVETETISDSATLVPTSTAEATTTTSSAPEIPFNRVRNPGFEQGTTIPWEPMSGSLSITSSDFYSGSQSGYYAGSVPMDTMLGVRQFIDPSWIEPGKLYKFSVSVKITNTVGCGQRFVACGHGPGTGMTGAPGTIDQSPNDDFSWASVTCSWTQTQLEAGPSVQIRTYCKGFSFFFDDASLEEVETLG